jgi:hypothetical protein
MSAFSKLMAVTFATLLSKPFKDWKAFELGLIDEKGNLLRNPENRPERDSLAGVKDLVRKIKRLMVKVIPDSRLLGLLVTAYLLKKESVDNIDLTEIKDLIEKELTESEFNAMISYIKSYKFKL